MHHPNRVLQDPQRLAQYKLHWYSLHFQPWLEYLLYFQTTASDHEATSLDYQKQKYFLQEHNLPDHQFAKPQETVDLARMENTTVTVGGRHDSCVALRAAPVVEAAAALAICRLLPADDGSLAGLRRQLDDVDEQMTALLARRLALAGEIGRYKAAQGLPVLDEAREKEVLARRGDLLPQRRQQVERLFRLLMAESREEQERHA